MPPIPGYPMLRFQGLFDPYKGTVDNPFGEPQTELAPLGIIRPGTVYRAPVVDPMLQESMANHPSDIEQIQTALRPPTPAPVQQATNVPRVQDTPPNFADYSPDVDTGAENRIMQIYDRMVGPRDDRLRSRLGVLLDQQPMRGKPNKFSRIYGAMEGFAHGPEAQDRAMYDPYYRSMTDWKARWDPTLQAANIERGEDTNQRLWASSIARDIYNQGRLKVSQDAEERRYQTAQSQAESRAINDRMKEFALLHPDLKPIFSADGYIHWTNPKDPTQEVIGEPHGKMTQYDKELWTAYNTQYRVDNQRTTGSSVWGEARERFDSQGHSLGFVQTNKETGEERWTTPPVNVPQPSNAPQPPTRQGPFSGGGTEQPPSGTGKQLTPEQSLNAKKDRMDSVILANPAWRRYIHFDPNSKTVFVDEQKHTFLGTRGPDPAERQQIVDMIEGRAPIRTLGATGASNEILGPGEQWIYTSDGRRVKARKRVQ